MKTTDVANESFQSSFCWKNSEIKLMLDFVLKVALAKTEALSQ